MCDPGPRRSTSADCVAEGGCGDRGRTPLRLVAITMFLPALKRTFFKKRHTRACTNDNPENPVRHSWTLSLPPPSVRARLAPVLASGWKTGQARRDHQQHDQKPRRERTVRLPRQNIVALIPGRASVASSYMHRLRHNRDDQSRGSQTQETPLRQRTVVAPR